jgi:hypothetical protein
MKTAQRACSRKIDSDASDVTVDFVQHRLSTSAVDGCSRPVYMYRGQYIPLHHQRSKEGG